MIAESHVDAALIPFYSDKLAQCEFLSYWTPAVATGVGGFSGGCAAANDKRLLTSPHWIDPGACCSVRDVGVGVLEEPDVLPFIYRIRGHEYLAIVLYGESG